MRESEAISRQIREEIERRGGKVTSLEEMNEIAAGVMKQRNNSPLNDFEGLTSLQMQKVLYDAFSDDCIIKYSSEMDEDIISGSPLVQMCLHILAEIRTNGGLSLTAKGKLSRQTVSELYNLRLYTHEAIERGYSKVLNEDDYLPAVWCHILLKNTGIVKVSKNKLIITRQGYEVISLKQELFKSIFSLYITRINKSCFDYYGDNQIGHLGIVYVIYLLHLYGKEWHPVSFYAEKYFRAFPMLIEQAKTYIDGPKMQAAVDCFILRVFTQGLSLFGLIEKEFNDSERIIFSFKVKRSKLFDQLFKLN